MTDETEKQSTPDFSTDAFLKSWQDKWAEMLKQQGWPDGKSMPGFGQMPFMMPFMQPFGGGDTQASARIAELEQRIAVLEKKMMQRNKAAPRNKPSKA